MLLQSSEKFHPYESTAVAPRVTLPRKENPILINDRT